VSDYFSKWTESFAMSNMEAETVAKIIVEQVIARFGVPSYIHSDQGRQFESSLFSEIRSMGKLLCTRFIGALFVFSGAFLLLQKSQPAMYLRTSDCTPGQ
jgi:transposase InsO family protein